MFKLIIYAYVIEKLKAPFCNVNKIYVYYFLIRFMYEHLNICLIFGHTIVTLFNKLNYNILIYCN